ncbi:MAG: helix-turn-helix domain-containing protein, partial [Herminiimonas sp.]|nr:helix-turn-helix domain-containing protein [Herminiimonas sp.]
TTRNRCRKHCMLIAHQITLDPTCAVRKYFDQACGTDRFTWNWGLAE